MDRRGFTLIEVLVVIIIMAVLVGTAVVSLGAGLKSAHMRDASRAVEQYVRHAKAVALLKQRPVVITFEEICENGEFVKSRVSLDFSADSAAERGATPVGQGFDTGARGVKTTAWNPEEDDGQPIEEEAPGDGAAPASLPEDDPLAAPPREFEGIHIRGEQREEREEARARISIFSNADFLKQKSAAGKQAAAPGDAESADAADAADVPDEGQTFSAVYESNGRCDPFRIRIWKDGDNEDNATTINVGRFGRAVTEDGR